MSPRLFLGKWAKVQVRDTESGYSVVSDIVEYTSSARSRAGVDAFISSQPAGPGGVEPPGLATISGVIDVNEHRHFCPYCSGHMDTAEYSSHVCEAMPPGLSRAIIQRARAKQEGKQ
jgi:hypothetical protein